MQRTVRSGYHAIRVKEPTGSGIIVSCAEGIEGYIGIVVITAVGYWVLPSKG